MTLNFAITVFCVILVILYIIGNYQSFQDENQEYILSILSYASIFNSLFSITLSVETFIKIFTEKNRFTNILNLIALIFAAVFCILCTSASNIISYISGGIK